MYVEVLPSKNCEPRRSYAQTLCPVLCCVGRSSFFEVDKVTGQSKLDRQSPAASRMIPEYLLSARSQLTNCGVKSFFTWLQAAGRPWTPLKLT